MRCRAGLLGLVVSLLGGCAASDASSNPRGAAGSLAAVSGNGAAGLPPLAAGSSSPSPLAAGSGGAGAGAAASPLGGAGQAGTLVAGAPAANGGSVAPPPADISQCPAPPADAPASAIAALNAVNKLRVAAGVSCATLNLQIVQAATNHCNYYQTNNKTDAMCTSNAHAEVMGCAGFTGASPLDRMKAAGFAANGGGEVMAFVNNPESAVQTWVDSVWHRIPILDPATNQLGYGSAAGCDTIDFGPGTRPAATSVVVYPYDGQTGIAPSFNGQYEGPMPPAPSTGWPSSNPITLYAQKPMVTEHVLTVDGSSEPIEHVFLDATSTLLSASDQQFLRSSVFMYANTPFQPNTKYRVKISGTYAGGALLKEWTFTTGASKAGFQR